MSNTDYTRQFGGGTGARGTEGGASISLGVTAARLRAWGVLDTLGGGDPPMQTGAASPSSAGSAAWPLNGLSKKIGNGSTVAPAESGIAH